MQQCPVKSMIICGMVLVDNYFEQVFYFLVHVCEGTVTCHFKTANTYVLAIAFWQLFNMMTMYKIFKEGKTLIILKIITLIILLAFKNDIDLFFQGQFDDLKNYLS